MKIDRKTLIAGAFISLLPASAAFAVPMTCPTVAELRNNVSEHHGIINLSAGKDEGGHSLGFWKYDEFTNKINPADLDGFYGARISTKWISNGPASCSYGYGSGGGTIAITLDGPYSVFKGLPVKAGEKNSFQSMENSSCSQSPMGPGPSECPFEPVSGKINIYYTPEGPVLKDPGLQK